jgi:hypothetical protein
LYTVISGPFLNNRVESPGLYRASSGAMKAPAARVTLDSVHGCEEHHKALLAGVPRREQVSLASSS